MTKQELIKKYQEIILKTNGGSDDYVVALCQIGSAINELDEPEKQTAELKQSQNSKAIETLEGVIKFIENTCGNYYPAPFEIKSFIQNKIAELKSVSKH